MSNEDIFNEAMSLVMEMDRESRANFSNKLTSHLKSKKHFNLENKITDLLISLDTQDRLSFSKHLQKIVSIEEKYNNKKNDTNDFRSSLGFILDRFDPNTNPYLKNLEVDLEDGVENKLKLFEEFLNKLKNLNEEEKEKEIKKLCIVNK